MSSNKRAPWGALLIALACVAYAQTLRTGDFFQDDQAIIAENPVLRRGWRAAPELFRTGYWEAVHGDFAPVQEYRPLLMLSFLLQVMTTGFRPQPMHAVNLLLHILACLLLWEALRSRMEPAGAWLGALIYALLPIHTEAVSALTGRSEVLSTALMLGSWLCLEETARSSRLAAGLALFSGALLTKESSVVFPVFLALSDWTFHGATPLEPGRRRLQAWLWACVAATLALRWAVLPRVIHGGIPYFPGRLAASLTLPGFALRRYLWPSLAGTGLCSDLSRPLIPDAPLSSPWAWLSLAAVLAAFGSAAYFLIRRRVWAFWLLGPCLFLLPTSHLIFPLDTIGAERFLYAPTIGLAAGWGHLYAWLKGSRRMALALCALALPGWYLLATLQRNKAWSSRVSHYEAAVACNPKSAKSRSALGASLLAKGRLEEGTAHLFEAIRLDPRHSQAYYNLGKLSWERREAAAAERHLRKALELDPKAVDAWVLLALVLESQGRMEEGSR